MFLGQWLRGSAVRAIGIAAALAATLAVPFPARAEEPRFDFTEELRARTTSSLVGARSRADSLPIREVTVSGIVEATLGNNLDILVAGESTNVARARVTQADAAFDPTLFTSLNFTMSDNFQRWEYIGRLRDTDPFATEEEEEDELGLPWEDDSPQQSFCQVTIDGETYSPAFGNVENGAVKSCFEPPVFTTEWEAASTDSMKQQTFTGTIGIGKRFLIGAQASISVSSQWRKKYSFKTPFLTTNFGPDDPFLWGPEGQFWTSSASLTFTMPLPYTKNYGREGNPDAVSLRLAENNVQRTRWADKATRNAALTQALAAYWDLVLYVQTLRVVGSQKAVLARRLATQQRLYDSGINTRYDVAQVEADIANLDSREELAWDRYLAQSNRLLTLLGTRERMVLVPADGEALLEEPVRFSEDAAYDRALVHPEVRTREQDYEASKVALAFRENQALPDLSLTITGSVGQNDAAFGYPTPQYSLARLVIPDSSNVFVGLRFRMPLGNVGAEAALARARIEERQAWDRVRQTRQQISNEVEQAISTLLSSELLVSQAQTDLALARIAVERAVELREQGLVSEFEVVNRYNDLLNAHLSLAESKVGVRKAHVRLLSAQGILEQETFR